MNFWEQAAPYPDNRFKPLTSNCDDMPTFFVDSQAPLDISIDSAIFRIGAVECESFILSDFALLCAIPLRDGCDVLEAVSQRLRPRTQGVFTA